MPDFDGVCMFCGKTGIDISHVSACSFKDAKGKLEQRGFNVEVFVRLAKFISMAKTYEASAPDAQALMCVCILCGEFDFIKTIHPVCACCSGLHTTVRASKYIEELMVNK